MPPSYPSMVLVASIIQDDVSLVCGRADVYYHIYLNSWLLERMRRKRLTSKNMTVLMQILRDTYGYTAEWHETGLTVTINTEDWI